MGVNVIIIIIACVLASLVLAVLVWKADKLAKCLTKPSPRPDEDLEELRKPITAPAGDMRRPSGSQGKKPVKGEPDNGTELASAAGALPRTATPVSARRMPFAFGVRDDSGNYVLTEDEYKELKRQLAGARPVPFHPKAAAADGADVPEAASSAPQPLQEPSSSTPGGHLAPVASPRLPFTPRSPDTQTGLYTFTPADVAKYQERLHGARPLAFGGRSSPPVTRPPDPAAGPSAAGRGSTGGPRLGAQVDLQGDGKLLKNILVQGVGTDRPMDGSVVTVSYVGLLPDGTIFDQAAPDEPLEFVLGQGMVIDGWEMGIKTMTRGESAVLTIAPDYAYGTDGEGSIPPNTTLTFEVTLLDVVGGDASAAAGEDPESGAWAAVSNVFAAIPKLRLR